jgi:succinate dehydrogenase / fumarate reductase, cytochrome b subunit
MKQPNTVERPLSPHLQIYRPMLSMMMSITHRITGAALFFGMILLVWWLFAAAWSDAAFDVAQGFFGHWFGLLVLFGFTWALIHHLLGGLRHFIWDAGKGFELATVELLVWANLIGSIVLTALFWFYCYRLMS